MPTHRLLKTAAAASATAADAAADADADAPVRARSRVDIADVLGLFVRPAVSVITNLERISSYFG